MKLVTGMFKSQVFFNGQLLDVAWSQTLDADYKLEFVLYEPKYPLLLQNLDFIETLYRRSIQIEEAKTFID